MGFRLRTSEKSRRRVISVCKSLEFFFERLFFAAKSLCHRDGGRSFPSADVLLISSDSNHSDFTSSGLKFDRFLDSIAVVLDGLGLTSVSIGRPPSLRSSSESFNSAFLLNRGYFSAFLLDWLAEKIGVKSYFAQKFWERIFSLISPNLILVIGARKSYVAAARKLNIPLAEVLHGRGYVALKNIFPRPDDIPDHILSFDAESSRFFSGLVDAPTVWDVQNFWLSSFGSDPPYRSISSQFAESFSWGGESQNLALVTLQWGFSGEIREAYRPHLVAGCMPPELDNLILSGVPGIHWLIRMHPSQWQSTSARYRRQKTELLNRYAHLGTVNILQASTTPLPLLLQVATVHLTISSTSAYEASLFGLRTLFLQDMGNLEELGHAHFLNDLVNDGWAEVSPPAAEFIEAWIKSNRRDSKLQSSDFGEPLEVVLSHFLRGLNQGI